MEGQKFAGNPQLKPSVVLTGTAKEGSAGPPVGLVDIGESEGAYLFRVALPGVKKDQCKYCMHSLITYPLCYLLCPSINHSCICNYYESVFRPCLIGGKSGKRDWGGRICC